MERGAKKVGFLFLIVAAIGLFLVPVAGFAYEGQFPGAAGATSISDSDIEAFARVQGQIVQLQERYNQRMAEAADDAERQEINQQANQEMVDVIQSAGLSIEMYNQILTEAQNNPEIIERINRVIQEGLR